MGWETDPAFLLEGNPLARLGTGNRAWVRVKGRSSHLDAKGQVSHMVLVNLPNWEMSRQSTAG